MTALPQDKALLAGGSGQIKQVASLQKQLSSASSSFASTAANDLYGAGVNAAQGLVNGLKSKQAAITEQMKSIATSMVASIKKALSIHSPSRVFAEQVGRFIPAGIAEGVNNHAAVANAAVSSLVSIPTVGTGSVSAASGVAGGTTTYNIYEAVSAAQQRWPWLSDR